MKIDFIPANGILNSINSLTNAVNSSVEKLSTGKRINNASDSPGEISFTARLKAAIDSQKTLLNNIQDGISLFQTADYSLSGSSGLLDILNTIREKIVQAGNITLTSNDRTIIQNEINNLIDEIDNITTSIEFNTKKVLNGDYLATVTSSSPYINAYPLDKMDTVTIELSTITGASYHKYQNSVQPNPTVSATTDYTATLGTLGTVSTSGTASASNSYEIIFQDNSSFNVYDNSTGTLVTSSTTDTPFTLDGVTITISSGGTYSANYKIYLDTTSGSATVSYAEGNRGTSPAISNATWSPDVMLNSYFYIKTDFDGSTLKYNVFDKDNNAMGNWTTIGSQFTAFSDSKLAGSTFTFNVTNPGKGDIWKIDFGSYNSLSTSGGTFVIEGLNNSITVSWNGNDRLSDIVNRINSYNDVASATLTTSGSNTYLVIKSLEKGSAGKIRIYDSSGNFTSTLGLTEVSNTGVDASFTYNGKIYTSSTGEFNGVINNLLIKVKDESNVDSALISVINKSTIIPLNINGTTPLEVYIKNMTPEALGLKDVNGDYAIDVSTSSSREKSLSLIDSIIEKVSTEASRVGSMENVLSYHLDQITSNNTALNSSYSNHMDTDIAEELAKLTVNQMLLNSATTMLTKREEITIMIMTLLGVNTKTS
ncbi:flagellin [Deferribacter abyssi]|uniref:flagellin N-terminal helical domain-containing protein n=1 Tax=Deferribacter abyssi TaxID=213806 RepID=UPI003C1726FE